MAASSVPIALWTSAVGGWPAPRLFRFLAVSGHRRLLVSVCPLGRNPDLRNADQDRPRRAVVGRLQVLFVDEPHQPKILGTLRRRLVIVRTPRQAQQFALLGDAQLGMVGFDPWTLLNRRTGQLFF